MSKIIRNLICIALIIAGIVCSIELIQIFGVKSETHGEIQTIEKIQDYREFGEYDIGLIEFERNGSVYTAQVVQEAKAFNGLEKDYTMLVNDSPVTDVEVTNGTISGVFSKSFYNTDGSLKTTAELEIVVTYTAKQTTINFKIENKNDSISNFQAYQQFNGFVLKVVERSK